MPYIRVLEDPAQLRNDFNVILEKRDALLRKTELRVTKAAEQLAPIN